MIGGAFRFWGGYAIGFFMPSYFGTVYKGTGIDQKKLYTDVYSVGNALVVSICGFASALLGGMICDKLEKKGYLLVKSQVAIWSALLGIPTIALCLLVQSNIYFSLTMLGLEYLVAECWISPVITMLVNTISPENKGFGVSAFLFLATMAGTLSTTLLGILQTHFIPSSKGKPDDWVNPKGYLYGWILCAFVVFSYAGSMPFFLLAGNQYKKVMLQKQQ